MAINGVSSQLSWQLQTLGSAALNKYQGGTNFSFNVNDGGNTTSGTQTNAPSDQLSGNVEQGSLIAVGTFDSSGKLDMFSPQQIQSEENMVSNMESTSFANNLQNFLELSQESNPNGEITASSYKDQQSFTGDNGLVSVFYNTSFSITPANSNSQTIPAPGSTVSTTA